jgi:hypothetical protein
MTTRVEENAECASMCSIIWLGGMKRLGYASSHIAFHGVYNSDTGEVTRDTATMYAKIGGFLAHCGLNYEAIDWIISAPSGSAHFLTPEAAAKYHIAYTVIDAKMANPYVESPRSTPPEPRASPRSAPPMGTPYTVNSLAYLYADQFPVCARPTAEHPSCGTVLATIPAGSKVLSEQCVWHPSFAIASKMQSRWTDGTYSSAICPVYYGTIKGQMWAADLKDAAGRNLNNVLLCIEFTQVQIREGGQIIGRMFCDAADRSIANNGRLATTNDD